MDCVEDMFRFLRLFNGRRVVTIVDSGDWNKAAEIFSVKGFEVKLVPKLPSQEYRGFVLGLDKLRSEEGWIFRSHTKGVSAQGRRPAWASTRWRRTALHHCLSESTVASLATTSSKFIGTHWLPVRIAGSPDRPWKHWHFAGSSYWMRPQDIPADICSYPEDLYLCEYYPGIVCDASEVTNLAMSEPTLDTNKPDTFGEIEFWTPSANYLELLAKRYGTDKGKDFDYCHGYTDVYSELFEPIRDDVTALLEFGIGQGGSMLMWREYFLNAHITGVDCERDHKIPEHLKNYSRLRILNTDYMLEDIKLTHRPDIIIDDGSHYTADQQYLFQKYWQYVKSGGYYIIEDLHVNYHPIFNNSYEATIDLCRNWERRPPTGFQWCKLFNDKLAVLKRRTF
jgi:hypothetical protein